MEKPKRLIELEELAKELDFSSDLLGNLEAEDGLVEVTLVNGEKLLGRSDFITWDGEDGLDRSIRFIPKGNAFEKGIYLKEDEVLSYKTIENSFKNIEVMRKHWADHPEEYLDKKAKMLAEDDFEPVAISPEEFMRVYGFADGDPVEIRIE